MKKAGSKTRGLPVINTRAAGIDISSCFHVVAVPADLAQDSTQTFNAFTADLERMANWLVSLSISTVAMELIGVYWIPVYEILETHGLHVVIANGRNARAMPGRKPTRMIRSEFNDSIPSDCFELASAQIAKSRLYAAI